MKLAIMMFVAVVTCFPFMKANTKGETKNYIYLNITYLNCSRKSKNSNCGCQSPSPQKSSTGSLITTAHMNCHI